MVGQHFWDLHPWLKGRTPNDLRHHLPLMIFDDAGPVSKKGSAFVRVFYSILGSGAEMMTRFLIGTAIKGDKRPEKSWDRIMEGFEDLAGATDDHDEWKGVQC